MPRIFSILIAWCLLGLGAAVPAGADDPSSQPGPGAVAPTAPTPAPEAQPAPSGPTTPKLGRLYQDGHGGRFLLDGSWHFRLDPQNQGLRQGFARSRSPAGWQPIAVPYAWNATDLSDDSQRGSIGWYRKDFRAPRASRTVSWRLRFESVNYRARVYLNGRELGRHEGAQVPFEVPASKLDRRGVNRLVVRVENRRRSTDLPPGRDQANGQPGGGWWNYGGLLREVYLRRVDRVDIAELLARPTLRCRACDATVLLRATLRNVGGARRKVRVRASVGGVTARLPAVELAPGAVRDIATTVRIRDPRLWEPGSPELYPVRATAVIGRRTVASHSTHIGIRSVRVRGGRLLLNGRPLKLLGASIHEDHPPVGAALSGAQRTQLFQELLDLGATVTRAHYPLHPHFLEMADRAGVLVWDQIPFYQIRNEAIRRKKVRSKGLSYLEATIRRDQNHPSVFAWSIANELQSRVTRSQDRYIKDAKVTAKRLDPTRLTAIDFAGYPSVGAVEAYRRLDAVGVNSYFGWYPGPGGQVIEREQLGPYLDQLHRFYRRSAVFVTEFGAEANRTGPIDEKGTFEFQRELMQFHVETYAQKPFVSGAMAWILRDFRVRPGWDGGNPKPRPPVNFKGLIDEAGNRKPAFDEVSRLYRDFGPLE